MRPAGATAPAGAVTPYAASGWQDPDAALRLLALASAPYDAFVWRDPARAQSVARRLWDADAGEVAPGTTHVLVAGGALVGTLAALGGPAVVRRRLQAALALTRGGLVLTAGEQERARAAAATMLKPQPDDFYLARLAVDAAARGTGAGRRLLAAFFAAARAAGATRAVLEVATDNAPAVRLYEGHGFVAYAERVAEHDGRALRFTWMAAPVPAADGPAGP